MQEGRTHGGEKDRGCQGEKGKKQEEERGWSKKILNGGGKGRELKKRGGLSEWND